VQWVSLLGIGMWLVAALAIGLFVRKRWLLGIIAAVCVLFLYNLQNHLKEGAAKDLAAARLGITREQLDSGPTK
jgi:hypothetical protein